jgi:hypothetical protein
MYLFKSLAALALGSAFLVGCGAQKGDEMTPADATDAVPSDEADPAMSDTLPTAEKPPPTQPPPPG